MHSFGSEGERETGSWLAPTSPILSFCTTCLLFLVPSATATTTIQANDLANVTIRSAHMKSVVDIAQELAAGATRLRAGQDRDFEKSKPLMRLLPTWLLSRVVKCVPPFRMLYTNEAIASVLALVCLCTHSVPLRTKSVPLVFVCGCCHSVAFVHPSLSA
jgi:hypothetical protein